MVSAADFEATTEQELRAAVVDSVATMEEELTITAVDWEVTNELKATAIDSETTGGGAEGNCD